MEVFGMIIVCMALFFISIMVYDGNHFHVVEYTIASNKLRKETNMVVLSDLHNKSYGEDNQKLVQAIKQLKPDGILIGGDILTAKPNASLQTAVSLIKQLALHYPIYYGMGNHEYRMRLDTDVYGDMYARYEAEMNKANVKLMTNKRTFLRDKNIDICGLEIDRCYYKKSRKPKMQTGYINSKVGDPNRQAFQIVLAHNPEYFERYVEWGADLVVSGHVHGGVMNCPFLGGVISPSFRLFPKYDGGVFQKKGTSMIVSRGLGMHTIPIRIFNPGEVILVHLKPKHLDK